jgi:hypothetical protein
MDLGERLLADVAIPFAIEPGRLLASILRLRRLQPQRRVHRGTALHAQAGLLERLPVLSPGRLSIGAPQRLCHPDEGVTLGFRYQAGDGQQLTALLRGEPGEVRTICLDGSKHSQARLQIFSGNVHALILWVSRREGL